MDITSDTSTPGAYSTANHDAATYANLRSKIPIRNSSKARPPSILGKRAYSSYRDLEDEHEQHSSCKCNGNSHEAEDEQPLPKRRRGLWPIYEDDDAESNDSLVSEPHSDCLEEDESYISETSEACEQEQCECPECVVESTTRADIAELRYGELASDEDAGFMGVEGDDTKSGDAFSLDIMDEYTDDNEEHDSDHRDGREDGEDDENFDPFPFPFEKD